MEYRSLISSSPSRWQPLFSFGAT